MRPCRRASHGPSAEPAIEDERDAGENREGREAIERCPGESPPLDAEALNERAEDNALGQGGDDRSDVESMIPERPAFGVTKAKLERDAAKHEGQRQRAQFIAVAFDQFARKKRRRRPPGGEARMEQLRQLGGERRGTAPSKRSLGLSS